jgi:hypothetical protein
MNSERRDKCFWGRSAVGSGISALSEYPFRAEAVEYYGNKKRGCPIVNGLNSCRGGHQKEGPTYELFASTLHLYLLILIFVSGLTRLGGMEPTADAQPLAPFWTFLHHNLFHGMVTPPGLHFEEDELVPAGGYGFGGGGLRFGCTFNDWVQLQRASVLWVPRLPVWQGHV